MKRYRAIGKQEVSYRVTVFANSKTEATKKIRRGEVDTATEIDRGQGYKLGGGGYAGVEEIES